MKYPEFTYSSDVNEIYDYIEEFRDYCKVIYTTKGFYLVEQILCSLKGLSQEWFRAEVIGADDYVENEFNLEMFCKLFKQRFLPSDHLIILFKQTTMNFKFNFSNPRKSFDPILISMNRLKGQITEEQFFVLLCYCLHTPTGIQERMDLKVDLENMHTFIDAYVKHIRHCGDGKTGLDTLDYVNIPSILNTRNNYRAAKGFRPKRDKQAKPTENVNATNFNVNNDSNLKKRKGSTISTLSTANQHEFPLAVQLSGISEAEKKKYNYLPIQFIADEDHVKSEFCIVDSGATANFVSNESVDRFNLPTIDISPISMSTANGQQTIITHMIETPVRV
ncbi:unnamed protein product [[Candida] boidinii]|nr:unnamed protein product [[Candida] boidinii]